MDVAKDPLQPEHCAQKLAALAAPERLLVVRFLRDGRRNVTEIAEMLQVSAVNVAHHMRVLMTADLVNRQKEGRFVYYSLAPGVLDAEVPDGSNHLDLGCCRLELRSPQQITPPPR